MTDLLKHCHSNQSVASFYFYDAAEKHHATGFVYAYNDTQLIIKHISPYGESVGLILVRRADICRIRVDGKYEQKIQKLYQLHCPAYPAYEPCADYWISLLTYAKETHELVSVELEACIVSGEVLSCSENDVELELLDEYGNPNGRSCINRDIVQSVCLGSADERLIQAMRKLQAGK